MAGRFATTRFLNKVLLMFENGSYNYKTLKTELKQNGVDTPHSLLRDALGFLMRLDIIEMYKTSDTVKKYRLKKKLGKKYKKNIFHCLICNDLLIVFHEKKLRKVRRRYICFNHTPKEIVKYVFDTQW